MNWAAIGAVGEIIGAIAVVVSVIYLAIQVRKQAQELRLTATREQGHSFVEFIDKISQDKETARIWLRAMTDYENMDDEDRLLASFYIQRGFRAFEQIYLHTSSGNVDSAYFSSINGYLFLGCRNGGN